MNGKRALIYSLATLFVGQLIYYYPQMPEKIAAHFNAFGEPDSWTSKNEFFAFEIGLLVFMLALFFSMTHFLPKMPDGLINLPNKTYWLAPERRSATLKIVQGKMETFFIPLFLLLVLINQLVFRANLAHQNLSPISWLFIAAFVVFTIVWSFRLNSKFKVYEN